MSSAAVATAASPSSTSTSSTTLISKRRSIDNVTEVKLTSSTVEQRDDRSDPLPPDLRRILLEVAKTGACAGLLWNEPNANEQPSAVSSGGIHQLFAGHRRSPGSSFSLSANAVPPKKKHRNGLHVNRRRFGGDNKSLGNSSGKKRPLARPVASSGHSVGSGITSGSELDDSTQAYECDSEGTSATTNSERSVERRRRVTLKTTRPRKSKYKTLQEAFCKAIALVLDHSYRYRGGYKLSPSEIRNYQAELQESEGKKDQSTQDSKESKGEEVSLPQEETRKPSPEEIFQSRRKLLLRLVGENEGTDGAEKGGNKPVAQKDIPRRDGPPFTIQRIAEVIIAPERYYSQTHKLCNCLEKLLLVTSSVNAFGGTSGGETLQTMSEERELAALAAEKQRLESEERNRRLRRRMLSADETQGDNASPKDGSPKKAAAAAAAADTKSEDDTKDETIESLEAAARAQLRTKFDHVGIDSHSLAAATKLSPTSVDAHELKGIAGRSMTGSPPPPGLASNTVQSHGGVANFVRHLSPHNSPEKGSLGSPGSPRRLRPVALRVPSPILAFPAAGASNAGMANPLGNALHPNHGHHLLHLHNERAPVLSGIPAGGAPLDIVIDAAAKGSSASAPDVGDLENVSGRSSASNSDSESDDISFDDSASDRSDGSDSVGSHHEPFTAARVMALNRMQHQQRLQQNRPSVLHQYHGGNEGFRPPPGDHDYQSGDSIDSMVAEDSGESDSSAASDLAD